MRHVRRELLLLVGALLVSPLPLVAQHKPAQKAAAEPQKPPLVYEREVFSYPTMGRRNPFQPLVGSANEGPRFDQLRLEGIIYDAQNPSESVATVGTSIVTMSADSANASVSKGRAWYLKVGQTVGNVRVISIGRNQIVVDVENFGTTTRKIMRMANRGPEGGTS